MAHASKGLKDCKWNMALSLITQCFKYMLTLKCASHQHQIWNNSSRLNVKGSLFYFLINVKDLVTIFISCQELNEKMHISCELNMKLQPRGG